MSRNIEDRRGQAAGVGRKTKLSGGVIVVAIIAALLGQGDILSILGLSGGSSSSDSHSSHSKPTDDTVTRFLSFLIDDMEEVWTGKLGGTGTPYQAPKLVLFEGAVDSACGLQSSATGPFYCPGDQKLYLDTSFFSELAGSLGASGDFAQAYVVAHEAGHHVQTLMGTNRAMRMAQQRSPGDKNSLSVLFELQADCYAGVWGYEAKRRRLLDVGDREEAVRAAMAIGDDTLQKNAGRAVRPESFTHGTSEQRRTWFERGFNSGRYQDCNTFQGRL